MIGEEYREFLERLLSEARGRGPNNPALLRQMEIATDRLLLAPARAREEAATDPKALALERKQCNELLTPVWDRGILGYEITHWPHGPGSARAMALFYNNTPLPYDVPSHYTEWFLLTRDLAHAVRSRRDVLRDFLVRELNLRHGTVSVIDLACGPCQSLREALPHVSDPRRVVLRAIDKDELVQLSNRDVFQKEHGLPWSFEVANVLRADLGTDANDVVYSTGLYDYLSSRTLTAVWRKVYASLRPGGLAVLCVKDGSRFCPLFYRWAVPWSQFHVRTEREFSDVMRAAELPEPETVLRDATGCILFYMVRKPPR